MKSNFTVGCVGLDGGVREVRMKGVLELRR